MISTTVTCEVNSESPPKDIDMDPPKCGSYKKGTKIETTIRYITSINEFYFNNEALTIEHFKMMKASATIRYPSGHLMYSARPYTTDLGDLKIFISPQNRVFRCKVEDLYTVPSDGQLTVKTDLLMIDRGHRSFNVDLESLFDFQQRIEYYKEIEPEAILSRIYLGEPYPLDFIDNEMNKYFMTTMLKRTRNKCQIQILDYVNGKYHVDLFDSGGKSMLQHIRYKFRENIELYKSSLVSKDVVVSSLFEPVSKFPNWHTRKHQYNSRINKQNHYTNNQRRQKTHYQGSIQYFQSKIKALQSGNKESYLQKRFFRVKVLVWSNPDSFFVIPDDEDFLDKHEEFISEFKGIEKRTNDTTLDVKTRFKNGEKCFFRNEIDRNLGDWLRGVVVDAPKIINNGFLVHEKLAYDCDNNFWDSENLVYRIESIDYGFQCLRSSQNMLQVKNHGIFQRCPWALKCRLFGVNPCDGIDTETGYSETCLNTIDTWMRERILDNSRYAFFHVLFRSDVMVQSHVWSVENEPVEITLFHRFEPVCSIENFIGPRIRRTHYHCLNSFIIESGLASDWDQKTKKKSRVDLDHFLVNLLVQHDRI